MNIWPKLNITAIGLRYFWQNSILLRVKKFKNHFKAHSKPHISENSVKIPVKVHGTEALLKSLVTQMVKTFSTSYGTWRIITKFTKALYWTLSQVKWIQFTLSHPTSLRNILLLFSHLCLVSQVVSSIPDQNSACISHIWSTILNLLDLITQIIMDEEHKLLSSSYVIFSILLFLSLSYSPQHFILQPQSIFFAWGGRQRFTST